MSARLARGGTWLSVALCLLLAANTVWARGRGGGGGGRGGGAGFSRQSPAAGGSFSPQRSGGSRSGGFASRGAAGSHASGASGSESAGAAGSSQASSRQAQAQSRQQETSAQHQQNQETRSSTRTESREDWQQHQSDMQEDRQDFYDDEVHGHYYGDGDWDDDEGEAFAAGMLTGFAVGTVVSASRAQTMSSGSQASCQMTTVPVGDVTYYRCGPNWYQKAYSGGEVSFVVVAPPPGY